MFYKVRKTATVFFIDMILPYLRGMIRGLFIFILTANIFSMSSCIPGGSDGRITEAAKHVSKEPVIPRDANRIVINQIINRTENNNIPYILDSRIRESLRRQGRLTPVSSENTPDISLDTVVTEYFIQHIRFDGQGFPLKKRMRVSVILTLTDLNSGRVILQNSPVSAYREFSEIMVPAETERTALNLLLSHLADRITARITTGWYTEHMTPVEKGQR